jgi:hypothetical protein
LGRGGPSRREKPLRIWKGTRIQQEVGKRLLLTIKINVFK